MHACTHIATHIETNLPGSEGHLAVLAPAQLRELIEDGGQLV